MNEMMLRVLIISPEATLFKLLQRNLKANDWLLIPYLFPSYEYIEEHIIELLEQQCPHLVLLDVKKPTQAGIRVCLRIRELAKVSIFIVSTFNTAISEIRIFDVDSPKYLSEPVDIVELVKRIKQRITDNSCLPGMNSDEDETHIKIENPKALSL